MWQQASRRDLTPDFWRDLSGLLPASPVVLDVGSHHLEEARLLLPYLRDVEWHAFEADPNISRLYSGTVDPTLASRCRLLRVTNAAVCDEVGEKVLYLSEKRGGEAWTASSSICRPKNVLGAYPWLHFPREVRVPSTTLDALVAAMPGRWRLVERMVSDVLLVNESWKG